MLPQCETSPCMQMYAACNKIRIVQEFLKYKFPAERAVERPVYVY